MDLISVIVPVYNVAEYLNTCISSIINQTYPNLEILLIDDGSTDSSGQLCDAWEKKDGRIQVIHKENGGLSDARNTGLKAASGEWIIFVDSDDFIHPTLIEIGLKGIWKFQVDVVVFDYREVEESASELISEMDLMLWEVSSGREMLKEFLYQGKGYAMAWNKLYHRAIWDGLSFLKGKIHEDEFVIADIWLKAKRVAVTNQKLYYYRQREGSIMRTRKLRSYYDAKEAMCLRCEKLKDKKEFYFLAMGSYWLGMANVYLQEVEENKKQKVTEEMYLALSAFHKTLKEYLEEIQREQKTIKEKEVLYYQEIENYLKRSIELYRIREFHQKKKLYVQIQKEMTKEVREHIAWKQWFLWRLFKFSPKGYCVATAVRESKAYKEIKKTYYDYQITVRKRKEIASYHNSLELKALKKNRYKKKIILLNTPTHGNLGDLAIALAERKFVEKECAGIPVFEFTQKECLELKNAIKHCLTQEDILIFPGGGFLGSLWENEEAILLELLHYYKNNRIVIFPQTIYFEKTAKGEKEKKALKETIQKVKQIKIFLREKASWKFMTEKMNLTKEYCFLAPDIVTYLSEVFSFSNQKIQKEGILLCIRKDKEKVCENNLFNKLIDQFPGDWKVTYTDTVIPREVKREERKEEVEKKLLEFSRAKLIITDRLHGMIFAALAETPCIALDNLSKKVSGVYQWISYLDYITIVSKEELTMELVWKMMEIEHASYQNDSLRGFYEGMKKELLEWGKGDLYETNKTIY